MGQTSFLGCLSIWGCFLWSSRPRRGQAGSQAGAAHGCVRAAGHLCLRGPRQGPRQPICLKISLITTATDYGGNAVAALKDSLQPCSHVSLWSRVPGDLQESSAAPQGPPLWSFSWSLVSVNLLITSLPLRPVLAAAEGSDWMAQAAGR